ncbi:universal stress protein [Thermodesulfovibrio sp.]|jgi:nucleotide-binding universal stress UspA family protein|uniref:universal stress protein n=1 Tax=Thermodesulfovibrio TaxID=28261 RepID=UPI00261010BD|nr:universal stress protein [Thermodesulfovibrio sp.]
MISPEKIYVAIDFKQNTDTVLSYALWLSKVTDCNKITLFHIMEYTLTPPAYLMPYINREKNKIEENFKVLISRLANYQINVDYKILLGRLVESIKETVTDNSIAVIGYKSHITRPSTSERILKGMKIPTLIVKEKIFNEINPHAIEIKKIVCPVDFSDVSLRALDFAKEISEKSGSKLHVIHVIPEQKIRGIIEEEEQVKQYLSELKAEAEEKLGKMADNFTYEVLAGLPAEEIIKGLSDADLTVIGSKGRSYSEAFLIGSVAEAVIKNAKKPILLVH